MAEEQPLFVDPAAIDPKVVFADGGAESVIAEIEAQARGAASDDLSTATARKTIAGLAYRVARTKTALDDAGKDHVADLKLAAKVVDAERKKLRDRLDALRDEVRKPLTDWEEAEERRIEGQQEMLGHLENGAAFDADEPSAADVQERILQIQSVGANWDWEEFAGRADKARAAALERLTAMLETAKRREDERAELERLRQQEAERQERERIAAAAKQAGEAAVTEAEDKAAAELADAKRQIDEADERAENAAQVERGRIEAEQEAEEEAARERRASEEYRAHRAKLNGEAKGALMQHAGLSEKDAIEAVIAIVRGNIPHVTINY